MEEMTRLKSELEQVHIEDRNEALAELKAQHMLEMQAIATKFKHKEDVLAEEVSSTCRHVVCALIKAPFLLSLHQCGHNWM